MSSWQPVNLRERIVYLERIERFAPFKESLFVAKITDMRATARNHDGIGNKVELAFDKITPYPGNTHERPYMRCVYLCRMPSSEISQKCRPDILTWPKKNGVGMLSSLIRQ